MRNRAVVGSIPTGGLAGVAQLVERNLAKVEVAGSNPVTRLQDIIRGVAQSGRALRSGRRGPRFKSGRPD